MQIKILFQAELEEVFERLPTQVLVLANFKSKSHVLRRVDSILQSLIEDQLKFIAVRYKLCLQFHATLYFYSTTVYRYVHIVF